MPATADRQSNDGPGAGTLDEPANSPWVIGVAILVEWKLLRRGHIPPERVHLGALVLGGFILLRSLLTFAIASDITQVFFILAFLLGGAMTLLAWRGFVYMGSVAVVGWIAVAAQKLSLGALSGWSLILLAAREHRFS